MEKNQLFRNFFFFLGILYFIERVLFFTGYILIIISNRTERPNRIIIKIIQIINILTGYKIYTTGRKK